MPGVAGGSARPGGRGARRTSSASPRIWMKRAELFGSDDQQADWGSRAGFGPRRCIVVLTRAHLSSWSTQTRDDSGWPSPPIVVNTAQIGRVSRSRCDAGIGSVTGATRVRHGRPLARWHRGPRSASGGSDIGSGLGLGEPDRDRVAEVAHRAADVLGCEIVEGCRRRLPGHPRRRCRGPLGSGAAAGGRNRGGDPRIRRMLRSLAKPAMVLIRTYSPSKSHHTTEVCG